MSETKLHGLLLVLCGLLSYQLGAWLFTRSPAPAALSATPPSPRPAEPDVSATATMAPAAPTSVEVQGLRVNRANTVETVGEPFDPTLWPELPDDTQPIRMHVAELSERARQGDVGAACWLGSRLGACGPALQMRDALLNQNAESDRDLLDSSLAVREHFLGLVTRCQGLSLQDTQQSLPWLHQAARAGSIDALDALLQGQARAGAVLPTGDDYRAYLLDQDSLLWAGLRNGSLVAAESLILDALAPRPPPERQIPGRTPMTESQRLMLTELLVQIGKRLRSFGTQVPNEANRSLVTRIERLHGYQPLPPALAARTERLVAEMLNKGWSDPKQLSKRAQAFDAVTEPACTEFAAPIRTGFALSDVVQP